MRNIGLNNKHMQTIKIFLLIVLFTLSQIARGQETGDSVLSLKACIQLSFIHNAKLEQARLETEKSLYQYKEATAAGLPQIGGVASLEDYFDIPVTMVSGDIVGQPGTMVPIQLGTKYYINTGIQAGQMLYNASYNASVRLFKKACEISDLNFMKNKEELADNIARLYFFIQTSDLQLALLDSNLVSLQKVYQYSEQHYENGFIPRPDLDRVEVSLNNLKAEKERLRLARDQQINMLKYLIGFNQDQVLVISNKSGLISSLLFQPDSTFSTLTEMKLLEQQKELAKINLKLAQSSHVPSLSGYAGYSYQAPLEEFGLIDNHDNWYKTSFIGIKLSFPLFEGNRVRNKISQSRLDIEQANIGRQDLQNELNVRLRNASQKLAVNQSLESGLSINMKLAGNIYRITHEQYRQGVKSFTDVLNAQSEYNASHLSWLNALLQIKLSELELIKLNGMISSLYL